MVRTHNLQALLFLSTAILVAMLFLRDRQAPRWDPSMGGAEPLVLRHPLRVPLHVGSPSIDEIAAETRPLLLADEHSALAPPAVAQEPGPQLAPAYRPLDREWSADPLAATNELRQEPLTRRLIPAPAWSPVPERVREHRVVEGDTLKQLAARYLGDAERCLELYSYNRHVLASPEFLPLGTVLRLPGREQRSETRAPTNDWQVDLVPLE